MSNIFALSKVILKSSLNSFSVSKNKTLSILLWLLILVTGIVPIIILFSMIFKSTLETLVQINQEALFVNMMLLMITVTVLVFSLLHIPSVFYFSNDTEFFLALPVKPYEILMSKLLVVVLFEYIIVALIFVPFMVMYVNVTGSTLSILFAIVVGLLLPFVPVLISSLIIILLMNFIPFFRNKNILNLIIGLISIVMALGVNFFFQGAMVDQERLIDLIQSGENSLGKALFSVFPSVQFAGSAISNLSIIDLLIFIGITFGLLVLYLLFSQQFYLNGATQINDSAKSKRKFSSKQLSSSSQSSLILEFFKRDLKSIFRIPPYFLNVVLPALIMPVILFVLPFIGSTDEFDLSFFLPMIQEVISDPSNLLYYGVLGGIIIGIFAGMTNALSVTVISRDAKILDRLKSYPIHYFDMILGKLFVSLLITFVSVLLLMVALNFIIQVPMSLNMIVFGVAMLINLMMSLLFILFDLKKPNLKWTNEIQVIKQGMNVLLSTFGSMLLGGVLVAAGFILKDIKLIYSISMIGLLLFGVIVLLYYLKNHVNDMILKIEI